MAKKDLPEAQNVAHLKLMCDAPSTFEQAKAILEGKATAYIAINNELEVADILGRNNPRRLRGGGSNGAKPMLRRVLGTPDLGGAYPSFSLQDLSRILGKSESNIRTCLSDLRSTLYCGKEAPFITRCVRIAGVSVYTYDPKSSQDI